MRGPCMKEPSRDDPVSPAHLYNTNTKKEQSQIFTGLFLGIRKSWNYRYVEHVTSGHVCMGGRWSLVHRPLRGLCVHSLRSR